VCVALSGGRDSIALAHFLIAHQKDGNYFLSAVNCEHGIRGEESLRDSAFVSDFCKKHSLPLYTFSEDCLKKAREEKISVETAARLFRYGCFEKLLAEGAADEIATAHHADDNAETVLFNICRGTSLSGLKGIADRKGFVRPFISVTREEIDRYIKENALSYVEDSTNGEENATRNIIRRRVLPVLKENIHGAVKNISRLSSLAREDDEFLYSLSEKYLTIKGGAAYIDISAPRPLFFRAALTAIKGFGIEKDYTSEHLLSLFNLAKNESGSMISLPAGYTAIREYDKVCIYIKGIKPTIALPFAVGKTVIGGREVEITSEKKEGKGKTLRFDVSAIPEGAVFRFRRDGDIFKKFGGGTKKLKEFFCEKKIPLKERDLIPLIAKDNEVLAVCGVEISDKIKCVGTESRYIVLR